MCSVCSTGYNHPAHIAALRDPANLVSVMLSISLVGPVSVSCTGVVIEWMSRCSVYLL